jgi:hypothetical protein
MTNLRLLELICNSLNLTQVQDTVSRVVADVAKLQKLASKRKPRFTVDNTVVDNPFNYRAGGFTVDFQYYDVKVSEGGEVYCTLKDTNRVKVGVLYREALEEFLKFVEAE